MLGKTTQRLLSAVVVSMSIASLPAFSLEASAEIKESSNTEITSVDKSSVENNSEQGTQTGTNSEIQKTVTVPPIMDTTPIEPTKVFDNLSFVGTNGVGVWVLNTSNGIILIDSMNNTNDAKNTIIPGIKKLGLNPSNIKYVVVTHGHGDHYGGAQYIRDTYGSTILMSQVDFDFMNSQYTNPNATGPNSPIEFPDKPKEIQPVTDGQKFKLGNETITIVSTPGHTPGGISLLIPVRENGQKHTVALWGGTGLPRTLEDNKLYLNSLEKFNGFAVAANVDSEISAHPFADNSIPRLETLRNRKKDTPNPYIIGIDGFKTYIDGLKTTVENNIEKLGGK